MMFTAEKTVASICLTFSQAINIAVVDFYQCKSLGMQTLMDLLYVDFVYYHGMHQLLLCSNTLFLAKPMPTNITTLLVSRLPHFFVLAMCIQMSVIAIGKFIHVYKQHLILEANSTDKEIVNRIRIITIILIVVTESIAVYSGHVYREFEYLTGECYKGRCDQGEVAALYILLALILNGSLSLAICINERKLRRKIIDVNMMGKSPENDSNNKKEKMKKTLLGFLLFSLYGSSMILLMTQGKKVLSEEEIVRSVGLITICVVFPSAAIIIKKKFRVHINKRFHHCKAEIQNCVRIFCSSSHPNIKREEKDSNLY